MKLSLKYRIAVMIFLLEAVMMGLVLWQTLEHSFEASREQLTANEQTMLDVLSGISRVALLTEEYADLQPYLENLMSDPRVVRIMLADARGRVVASDQPEDVGSIMPSLADSGDYYWRSREITNAAGSLGVLAIEFSNTALLTAYRKAWNLGLGIAAVGMAIIAIASIFAGFLLTRRLERITLAARRFAQGELAVETGVHGNDELGELAESFDDMARHVAGNQRRVQESEQYHRMLFEQSTIGLALCRMNGELVDINSAYAGIIGRNVEETLGLTYWEITPEKYAAAEQRQLEMLNKTGRYGPYEKEYIHSDGHLVPVRLHGSILEKEGETFIWSSVEDITAHKQADEVIKQSAQRLADAQRMAHIGNWEMDLATRQLEWSDEIYRIFEISPRQSGVHYEDFLSMVHPDDRDRVNAAYMDSVKNKKPYTIEHRLRMQDGSVKYVQERCETFYDNASNVLRSVGTVQDITERVSMEETLRRTQKMEAIGQLSGGIAHDFNNQLGVVIGYLDYLKKYFPEDEKPHQWVETATRATLRCMDLTRQILAFSRRQSKEKVAVDLNVSLQDLENMIARSVTPEVEVQYVLADDLDTTLIAPGEFQDAILNLVINARDAMPRGGKLLIETVNKHLDEGYASLNPGVRPGDYVQLMLSDTGTGMDKDTLEHVFEPFFTTKPEGQGTGLGLAMVYGFVKRYNGHIKIYSEPGVGTAIRIYLPRFADPGSAAITENSDTSVLPTGSETVLIVEDEADLLHLADQYLLSLGYHTHLAENAAQALEILAAKEERIDLLFSDVVMPGNKNGYELAQQATEQRPDLKVLLTSGYTARTVANNGLARFSTHLLSKPYRKGDLAKRIRLVLDESKDTLTGRVILVVDDEEGVRELFKLNLEKLGCKTLPACNGDEAITLYRQAMESDEPVDAIILDLSIPGCIGGKEIADKLRTLDPDVKIIVASGDSEGPEMTHYQDYGFQGALEKDFNRGKIKQALEQVLGSG